VCANKTSTTILQFHLEVTGDCLFEGKAASIVTPTIKVHLMPRLRMSGFIPPLQMSGHTNFSVEISFVHAFPLTICQHALNTFRLLFRPVLYVSS
jgi:hypothetical protein